MSGGKRWPGLHSASCPQSLQYGCAPLLLKRRTCPPLLEPGIACDLPFCMPADGMQQKSPFPSSEASPCTVALLDLGALADMCIVTKPKQSARQGDTQGDAQGLVSLSAVANIQPSVGHVRPPTPAPGNLLADHRHMNKATKP
jgi:hypothetical protein